jgi:hypothetical protein
MTSLNPKVLLGVGFLLLVLGVVLPIMMVLQIIPSTFFLNFFSYGASLVGLIMGMIGIMEFVTRSRNRD